MQCFYYNAGLRRASWPCVRGGVAAVGSRAWRLGNCAGVMCAALLTSTVVAPYGASAATYRLYREVSQAWAARGFVARPALATYRAPGPSNDPWGPYIEESARRFAIPSTWIRAVMQQESGGKQYLNGELTTSGAGAMGLMQLMPATYADMQSQYNLGSDPYNPHDNIQAGAAYIKIMYDKYGAPGFLAAYNAGPSRVDEYLATGHSLPDETVNYVAAITPHLGGGVAVRGNWGPVPFSQTGAAVTAPESYYTRADITRTADGCLRDPNAEYDPSAPCLMDRDTPHPDPTPAAAPTTAVAYANTPESGAVTPQPAFAAQHAYGALKPQVVQVVSVPAQAVLRPTPVVANMPFHKSVSNTAVFAAKRQDTSVKFVPQHVLTLPSAAHAITQGPVVGPKRVQVGAFATYAEASRVAEKSKHVLALRALSATPAISSVRVGGKAFYRAQLVADSRADVTGVCQILRANAVPCIQVRGG